MDKQKSKITIGVLTLLIITIFALTINLGTKRKIDVKDLNGKVSNKQFAFYLQNESGNGYTQSSSNTFPTGYELNISQSKCINNNGTTVSISGVLSANDNKVTVKSSQTIYCTLYFDIASKNLRELCGNTNLSTCMTNNKSQLGKVTNLNSSLQGDLYRYQGSSTNVNNNFICIGGSKCTTSSDYMYQILGITSSGELKIVKYNAISGSNSGNYGPYYTFNNAYITTGYLNTLPTNFQNTVVFKDWKYGNDISANGAATNIYSRETQSINAKGGLISLADYYASADANCYTSPTTCKNGWLYRNSGVKLGLIDVYEGVAHDSFVIGTDGKPVDGKSSDSKIRPTFYTSGSAKITGGSGTASDPYILGLLTTSQDTLGNYIRSHTTSGYISNTLIGDMYRFQGTNTQVTDNYICIGSTSCTTASDSMYRIIGTTTDGKVKVIKNTSAGLVSSPYIPSSFSVSTSVSNAIESVKFNNLLVPDGTSLSNFYAREGLVTFSGTTKFALMLGSDYYYAGGTSSSWIYLGNAETVSSTNGPIEWLQNYSDNAAADYWGIFYGGSVYIFPAAMAKVRPAFYLKSTNTIKSGTGTSTNPYILNV